VPSPDPSAGTVLVRAVRVAGEDAALRRVDVDAVDVRALDFVPVDATAAVGFAAADRAAAGFAPAGFAPAGLAATGLDPAGFARAFERPGDAAREAGVTDRAPVAGLSSLIRAVSWATSARASDACFVRFASTSRAFRRRFSSRLNTFAASLAALLASAAPAD
jgi:hypothetical protein